MGQTRPLFVHFRPFQNDKYSIKSKKSLDVVRGIRTPGHRIVGGHIGRQSCNYDLSEPNIEQFFRWVPP